MQWMWRLLSQALPSFLSLAVFVHSWGEPGTRLCVVCNEVTSCPLKVSLLLWRLIGLPNLLCVNLHLWITSLLTSRSFLPLISLRCCGAWEASTEERCTEEVETPSWHQIRYSSTYCMASGSGQWDEASIQFTLLSNILIGFFSLSLNRFPVYLALILGCHPAFIQSNVLFECCMATKHSCLSTCT